MGARTVAIQPTHTPTRTYEGASDEASIQASALGHRRRYLARVWAARILLGAALLLGWQLVGLGLIDRFWISSPVLVGGRIWSMLLDGTLAMHLWATLEVAIYGLVVGMTLGVLAGITLGLIRPLAVVLEPYIMLFYTLPRIALAPLFIMYLGVGVVSKVAFAFTIVVFIALLNTFEGVRAVDSQLVDALRTMRASRRQIIAWVILPSIVPWVLATLRIGIGLAMIGAVVAELISSSRGLGWYMQRAAGTFDVTGVFTGMIVIAVAAATLNTLIGRAERRLLAWRAR